jgi:hypothetical protein
MPSRPYDAQDAAGLAEAMRLIALRDTGTQEAIGSSDVFDVQSKAGVKAPGDRGCNMLELWRASGGGFRAARAITLPSLPTSQMPAEYLRCLQVGGVPCDEGGGVRHRGCLWTPEGPAVGRHIAPDWWANDGSSSEQLSPKLSVRQARETGVFQGSCTRGSQWERGREAAGLPSPRSLSKNSSIMVSLKFTAGRHAARLQTSLAGADSTMFPLPYQLCGFHTPIISSMSSYRRFPLQPTLPCLSPLSTRPAL